MCPTTISLEKFHQAPNYRASMPLALLETNSVDLHSPSVAEQTKTKQTQVPNRLLIIFSTQNIKIPGRIYLNAIHGTGTKNKGGRLNDEGDWFRLGVATGFVVGFLGVIAPLLIYIPWRHAYFYFWENYMWFKIVDCYIHLKNMLHIWFFSSSLADVMYYQNYLSAFCFFFGLTFVCAIKGRILSQSLCACFFFFSSMSHYTWYWACTQNPQQ